MIQNSFTKDGENDERAEIPVYSGRQTFTPLGHVIFKDPGPFTGVSVACCHLHTNLSLLLRKTGQGSRVFEGSGE
jgi:hypothetical protein